MKIIIDTHILLWFLNGDKKLKQNHLELILNNENEIFISIASLWEIAIKMSLNKLYFSSGYDGLLKYIKEQKIEILPIEVNHLKEILTLKFYHGDPFDRLIISQSIATEIPIISYDKNLSKYEIIIL